MPIIWNLASVFGYLHPEWGPGLSWGLAAIAAVLFLCVSPGPLAGGQSAGLPVRHIRLFLFGGISNIEREPLSTGAEFVMAFVGPAASIILGLFLAMMAGIGAPRWRLLHDELH